MSQITARDEWKRYWPLVLTAAVGFSFTSFMTPAAGIFMVSLTKEFGWSRTELSVGIGVASLCSMLGSPFFGTFLDRWGVRRLAIPGLVFVMAAVMAFSLINGSFAQWIGLWLVWGLASLFVHSTTWSTAVAKVFVASRGLALGLTLSGTALAQIIVPPLANWLITTQGWRAAYFYMGLGWGGIALLLSVFFLFDRGSASRSDDTSAFKLSDQRKTMPGLTIPQAWRNVNLWKLAISTFLILTITIAVLVHQFPILLESGESRTNAAWLASLAGVAGIIGKLVTGTLLDRFHARWIGAITFASTAIAYPLLLASLHNPPLIVLAIVISGYAAGTKIQLCGYLTARYGGLKNYGAIFGFMSSMIALASAAGPISGGVIYDRYGSYAPLLIGGAIISLVAGALVFSFGAYPNWDVTADDALPQTAAAVSEATL